MTRRLALLSVALAAMGGGALLVGVAPAYLTEQGFPLDDAWIHAVYGRELARSGMLAYNPGVAATGSTAPLWSAVFAAVHLLTGRVGAMVVLVKVIGFALHVGTALLVYAALDEPAVTASMRVAGAVLVAIHPDLISASVSGMEVPLAAFLACALWFSASRRGGVSYGALSAVAVLARPELAVISFSLPLLAGVRHDHRRRRLLIGATTGCLSAMGLVAVRNLTVSDRPLPATFYAKVGNGPGPGTALGMGFRDLLGHLPVLDSSILLTGASLLAVAALWRSRARQGAIGAASAFVSGMIFCMVSFVLVAPVDPGAFYHQRYILPVLPLLVGPIPALADTWLTGWLPAASARGARVMLLALLCVSLLIAAPGRFQHLSNDTRNIDDVQVAVGRFLTAAAPTDVVWAIDAGAVRYFGNAFVVDMIGLNTPELTEGNAETFLGAHRPDYLEIVPGWSRLEEPGDASVHGIRFAPSTPYTVTAFQPMRNHFLARCGPTVGPLRFTVGSRTFETRCAQGPNSAAGAGSPAPSPE